MRCSSIITLPVQDTRYKNVSPIDLPVLFILDGDNQGAYWELAQYVHSELASGRMRARNASDLVRSVMRFIQVFDLYVNITATTQDTLADVLAVYCYARFSGTEPFNDEAWKQLNWSASDGGTVRGEFKLIVDFFDYCKGEFDYIGFTAVKIKYKKSSFIKNAYSKNKTPDFLAHLSTQRDRWEKLLGRESLKFPSILREVKSPPPDRAEKAIKVDEFLEIITRESNPVFKALFILYGCGGLRTSEPLHFWQVDILPSSWWEKINGLNSSEPLILRCHPTESNYLGDFGKGTVKRKEYLSSRYNMIPRNMLSDMDINYCGWKGTKFLHKMKFVPVFFWHGKILLISWMKLWPKSNIFIS